ncbi:MAG: potassium transporter TrkH [Desulfotignum sp.]|nr:potassium transporter TrkH [Desulfotignum sp.]
MMSRASMPRIGIEGFLLALLPLPLLFLFTGTNNMGVLPLWQLIIAVAAAVAVMGCALTLFCKPLVGKLLGVAAAAGTYGAAFPQIMTSPFFALTGTVILTGTLFLLADLDIHGHAAWKTGHTDRCLERAWWGSLAVPLIVGLDIFFDTTHAWGSFYVIAGSSLIAQTLFVHWAVEKKAVRHLLIPAAGILSVGLALVFSAAGLVPGIAVAVSFISVMLLPRSKTVIETQKPFWEIFLSHPARVLVVSFLGLCAMGTLLLLLPMAAQNRAIGFVDAAFTAVSAVCVTGLIVLDTPNDFTGYGQFFILVLIQLGGLGIMGITTVGLHTMGRRISLTHERVLASMADTNHKDLVHSLMTILKFTFAAEIMGAVLLTFLFYTAGDTGVQAVWRGIFTAVSAFCNAGFALQSDSLMSYHANPLVLHIVALLIIFGGMAPATTLVIPRWLAGKKIPIPARIALTASIVLLFLGMVFIMAFEWSGLLAKLSFSDKIWHAWFQSVTLRTAGFNSLDIGSIANPTFLLMIAFMFIGGSPGGTAGGVKTTTIGILAMTFFANITNRKEVIMQNRRISAVTIFRAVTIVAAGLLLWFAVVLMLEVTQQQIPVRDLVFEATSALGTVGLSTGATGLLDEIGKIIIIIAMFCGRIGPVTLFMLLSDEQAPSVSRCPDAKIFLT